MAKKNSPQIWLEYLAARTILFILRVLPRSAAMKIGMSAGSLGYRSLSKLRKVGERNLELAFPDKAVDERGRILKAAFQNMGRVMVVVSRFDALSKENLADLIEYEPDSIFAEQYERTK